MRLITLFPTLCGKIDQHSYPAPNCVIYKCEVTGRVAAIEWIVVNIGIEVEASYLANRIPVQPPSQRRVVPPIHRQIQAALRFMEQTGETVIAVLRAHELGADAIGLVIVTGLNVAAGINQVPHTAKIVASIVKGRAVVDEPFRQITLCHRVVVERIGF